MNVTMHDVIVMGGGPAGSTAASLLARDGFDVALFERDRFPRDHVGESMLPFCYPLFEDLGVLDKLKRSFVRKPGVRFVDRNGESSTHWCFSHVIHDESYLSFQVNRAEFDHILLNNSRENGAEVHEETKVKDVDLSDPDGGATVTTVDAAGIERTHRARFVIDASGRDALIGSRNGWRKPRAELDRTALWSHWTGVRLRHGLEEGLSLIIYIGEEKKGWIWVFPLSEDRITAGVVMQNSYIRDQRRKLKGDATDWKQTLTMQELRFSPLVAELLEGAEQALPILVNGDYSYEVTNHYGSNYAMIGDARGFIDPIFSSGVFLSIKTAYLVTAAVKSQLTGTSPGQGVDNPELVKAYEMVTGAYNFVHRMIRLFYSPHSITWAEVGAEHQIHKRHESAMGVGHFMLSGDFFENHGRYNKFFELLEDPRAFKRYKNVVLDRKDYHDESCRTPWDVAFGELASAKSK